MEAVAGPPAPVKVTIYSAVTFLGPQLEPLSDSPRPTTPSQTKTKVKCRPKIVAYFSVLISITKRYLTSPLTTRS